MGVTDIVKQARDEVKTNLHWEVAPGNAEQFEKAVRFCGLERFRLCLKLVTLLPLDRFTPAEQHERLIGLLRLTAPGKNPNSKYRNTAAGRAVLERGAMEAEMADAMARERCADHRTKNCAICEPLDLAKLPV